MALYFFTIAISIFCCSLPREIQAHSWDPLNCVKHACNPKSTLSINTSYIPFSNFSTTYCSQYLDDDICNNPATFPIHTSHEPNAVYTDDTTSRFSLSMHFEEVYFLQLQYVDIPSGVCLNYFHKNLSLKILCFNNNNNSTLNIYNGSKCDNKHIFKSYDNYFGQLWYSGHCNKAEYYVSIESYFNTDCLSNPNPHNHLQDIYARISVTSTFRLSISEHVRTIPHSFWFDDEAYFFDDHASFLYCPSSVLSAKQRRLLDIDTNVDKIFGMIISYHLDPDLHIFKTVMMKNGDCIPHWFLSKKCHNYGMYKQFTLYNRYCNNYANRYYFNGNNNVINYEDCHKLINDPDTVIYDGSIMPIKTPTLYQTYWYYEYAQLPGTQLYLIMPYIVVGLICNCGFWYLIKFLSSTIQN